MHAKARGVIALCEHAGGSAAVYLKGKYGMAADTICPIGVANTDRFMDAVCEMTGAEIHYSLVHGRGRLIDAMVDVHLKTCCKRDLNIEKTISIFKPLFEGGYERRKPLTTTEIRAIKEAHQQYPELGRWNLSLLLSNEFTCNFNLFS